MESALPLAIATCGTAGTVTSQAAASSGDPTSLLLAFGLPLAALVSGAGLIIIAAAAGAVLFVRLVTSPRRLAPAQVPVDARLSPDGHYWWDGAAWRSRS